MSDSFAFFMSLICLCLIVGIPYYICKQISKKIRKEVSLHKSKVEKEKREFEKNKVINEHIKLVEKGVELYNSLYAFSKNLDFTKLVLDNTPEFIIKDNILMIALPVSACSSSIQYYEETYNKLKEENSAPSEFWFEETSNCKANLGGDILEDHEYVFVGCVGLVNRRDDVEIEYWSSVLIEEILKRVKHSSCVI